MGKRVSTVADGLSASSEHASARRRCAASSSGGDSSTPVRRAFLIAVLVGAASSSSTATVAAHPGWGPALQSSSALTLTSAPPCCFVTADRSAVAGSSHKFRRRHRDSAKPAEIVPVVAPGGSCPFTSLRLTPSTSRLQFRSEKDVGADLASLPVSSTDGKEKKGSKGSWFKFGRSKRHGAVAASSATATADDEELERRKLEWAAKYTDISTLRRSFGTNRNKLWGDFDPETTRKLYHTLLPRALMALNDLGVMTERELAPLAYEARCAAKKYARERCVVPGRIFAMAYDGFRSWRDHGKWNAEGMTWDQVWEKYERQINDEFEEVEADADEITRQICLRILERSCRTNPKVDKIFLGDPQDSKKKRPTKSEVIKRKRQMDIAAISVQLEKDVHALLFEGAQNSILFEGLTKVEKRRRRREELRLRKEEKAQKKLQDASDSAEVNDFEESDLAEEEGGRRRLMAQEVAVLRRIALAKRKVLASLKAERRRLRDTSQDNTTHTHDQSEDGELNIFTSDLAVPPRGPRAHHGRRKVWQHRNEDARGRVLPHRRSRKRASIHPNQLVRE